MLNLDSFVIIILVILIISIYCNKYLKKEDFEVFFSPYYPISSEVSVKVNNFKGDIDDHRLNKLKEILDNVKFNANDGSNEYLIFNYADRPVIKSIYNAQKIKPVTDFLIEAINSNLPDDQVLHIKKLKEISKLEIEEEAKVTFKMICEYKFGDVNKNIKQSKNKIENNDLVIDVEVLSIKRDNEEKLHLNNLSIMGITNTNLPGSNYYKNDDQYLFTNSLTNKIIDNKQNNNNDEVNGMNDFILPNVSLDEETINEINTEDVESFFDM